MSRATPATICQSARTGCMSGSEKIASAASDMLFMEAGFQLNRSGSW